jgi:hypothetical protein
MSTLERMACVLLLTIACAEGASTIDPAHPHAYSANAGWINARAETTNGAVIGQAFCTGYLYGANVGWIHLGNGAPADGRAYANTSATDYGVNHDGRGNLSGHAYAANIGWVTFEQTHGQPRVDLRSGNLDGSVWSANTGWLSLSNVHAFVRTETLDTGPDTDGDAIPDAWEYGHTNTLTALTNGMHDADGDGATDAEEYGADTDPFDDQDTLRIISLTAESDTNHVAWTIRPTRRYQLMTTNSLTGPAGNWADAGGGPLGPLSSELTTQSVHSASTTTEFYRVHALIPLSE